MRFAGVTRLVIFVMTLTVHLNVHASDASTVLSLPKDRSLTEIPQHCLVDSGRCALKTSEHGQFKFPVGDAQVVMSNNTAVVKNASAGLTFISGAIWVRTPQSFSIETEFGEIRSAGDEKSEFWVVHRDGKIWAQAIENPVYLRPRGGKVDVKLEVGDEVWLGGVQPDGVAATGIAQPIYFPNFARQWARVYTDDRVSFKADLERVELRLKEAAARVATVQGELVQRQIASEKDAKAKADKAKAAAFARDQVYRDLFRQKILGN